MSLYCTDSVRDGRQKTHAGLSEANMRLQQPESDHMDIPVLQNLSVKVATSHNLDAIVYPEIYFGPLLENWKKKIPIDTDYFSVD